MCANQGRCWSSYGTIDQTVFLCSFPAPLTLATYAARASDVSRCLHVSCCTHSQPDSHVISLSCDRRLLRKRERESCNWKEKEKEEKRRRRRRRREAKSAPNSRVAFREEQEEEEERKCAVHFLAFRPFLHFLLLLQVSLAHSLAPFLQLYTGCCCFLLLDDVVMHLLSVRAIWGKREEKRQERAGKQQQVAAATAADVRHAHNAAPLI